MELYMIIKVCKQCYRFVAINLSAKYNGRFTKNVCFTGNLPELYNRMTIWIELDKDRVIDYKVDLTERNIELLEKNGLDVSEYGKALDIHREFKKEGYSWNLHNIEPDILYKKMPFSKADRLHKILYDNAAEKNRIEAICTRIIKYARSRHVIEYSIPDFFGFFERIEKMGAYDSLPLLSKAHCILSDRFGFYRNKVVDYEMKSKEDFIHRNIKERISKKYSLVRFYEIKAFIGANKDVYEKEQLEIVRSLEYSDPCVITGKAGTGKTSAIKLMIDFYNRFYGSKRILLVAPTGKASRRLSEKTGMQASTIHKALRKKPNDEFVYYNQYNPLPYDLIIVDESSMIDTLLMYDLLNAVSAETKIIFAGDKNQLSPVGYGEPFFDFLKLMPVYTLTQNHRQEEGTEILDVADSILQGKGFYEGNGVKISYVQEETVNYIFEELSTRLNDENYQIISPYNELNNHINNLMKKGDMPFNIGDKIIMTKNTENYCNGDIGYVLKAEYSEPKNDNEEIPSDILFSSFHLSLQIDERVIDITEKDKDDIMLAYAITVHKMQGSESDRVIIISPNTRLCLSNIRLMYTAVTRAKKEVDFIIYNK